MVNLEGLLEKFGDVPVALGVDLGTCRIAVGDLLQLRAGSELILEGASSNGSPVMAGNVRIGAGEVVELDGSLVVRIEELATGCVSGVADAELEEQQDA
jgi:flagellar motor switch/type III secretory pathway protein FliN